jgi:transcriptional regulator with XRE-family HTH domain
MVTKKQRICHERSTAHVESGAALRAARRQAGLSLAEVGVHFHAGVTRARVSQIETSRRVTADVERDYRAALAAACTHKEVLNAAVLRVRKEMGI